MSSQEDPSHKKWSFLSKRKKLLREVEEYRREQREAIKKDPKNKKWQSDLTDKLNAPIIRKVRSLFLQDYPYERIFILTGIPYHKFKRLSRRWVKLKARLDEKMLADIRKKAVSDQAKEFVEKGLKIGLMFLDRCIANGTDLTPKDFKLVMDSVMAIHRVKQLETGAPTDISAYEHMTPEELKAYLQDVAKEMQKEHGELISYDIENEPVQ